MTRIESMVCTGKARVMIELGCRAATRIAACVAGTLVLCSCVADSFGPRAVTYNEEAFDARSSVFLLNVLRSAYRLPLTFTDVTTVTGGATATGSVTSLLPVLGNSGTVTPMASLSGGPNFTVSGLETQEFYQGIQAPIPTQTVGLLISQGVRPEVLLPLVISEITIQDDRQLVSIKTDFDNIDEFTTSYAAILQLARGGLSVAKARSQSDVGPKLTATEAKSLLGDQIAASADARSGNKLLSLEKTKGGSGYSLKKDDSDFEFCFNPLHSDRGASEVYPNAFVASLRSAPALSLVNANRRPDSRFLLRYLNNCYSDKLGQKEGKYKIRIALRSLAGIYRYLGSIARLQLGLAGPPSPVSVPAEDPDKQFYLFRIRQGLAGLSGPSAAFNGAVYSIAADPTGNDASAEVAQITLIIQALNSKASALPSPSVAILAR